MPGTEPEGVVHAELFVRKELPPPAAKQAAAVEDRLREFVEAGRLGSLERADWAKRVPVESCEGRVRDVYLSATDWATDEGVRLVPFFETRECYSAEHGGMTDWLVVPAVCLVIYRDETVVAVYPHADDTATYTVRDGLQNLTREILDGSDRSAATAD